MESNIGKWAERYRNQVNSKPYGDNTTYIKGAEFLQHLSFVEDWGCGTSWFRNFIPVGRYRGIDGSHSKFVDKVIDLTKYRSEVQGLFIRHVLEHNESWKTILSNALTSFTERMVLVLFTPFSQTTTVLARYEIPGSPGMFVPDISFSKDDILAQLSVYSWRLEENIPTDTEYGVEHVFYIDNATPKINDPMEMGN